MGSQRMIRNRCVCLASFPTKHSCSFVFVFHTPLSGAGISQPLAVTLTRAWRSSAYNKGKPNVSPAACIPVKGVRGEGMRGEGGREMARESNTGGTKSPTRRSPTAQTRKPGQTWTGKNANPDKPGRAKPRKPVNRNPARPGAPYDINPARPGAKRQT